MKVFGIGFHKTGTTTLTTCLAYLGFDVCDETLAYQARASVAAKNYIECLKIADQHEAFADSPWCYRDAYRILDAVFPEARFVLTIRNTMAWYDSLVRWVEKTDARHDLSFFETVGHAIIPEWEHEIKHAYLDHIAEVKQYFANRPRKLLVVDWNNAGWKPLCDFLEKPIPEIPVPKMLKYDEASGEYVNEDVPTGTLADTMEPE